MLQVENLDLFHGDAQALDGVSLEIAEGTIVAIVGANGAGKTSLIRTIAGMHRPRRGRVVFRGTDITGSAPEAIATRGVALVPQGRRIFRSLSVHENLLVAQRKPRDQVRAAWNFDRVYATFPRLKERQHQVAGFLSGGEQQMLAIGRALMGNPSVLLMDEPSEGLAPQIVAEVMSTIRRLKQEGLSIVLVEQNPKLVFDIADDILILNSGRVAVTGTKADLTAQGLDLHQHLGIY